MTSKRRETGITTQLPQEWERPTLNDKELPYMIRKRLDGEYDVKLDRPLSEEEVVEEIGSTYQTIDGLLEECKMGQKRTTNVLKGFTGVMVCLASMSLLVTFHSTEGVRAQGKYFQSVENELDNTKGSYSKAYSFIRSNRFDEARSVMSNYFDSVKGGKAK